MAKPFKAPVGCDDPTFDSQMKLYSQTLPNMYHAYMEYWLDHGFERAFKWGISVTHVRISSAIEIGIDTFDGLYDVADLPQRVWKLVIFVGIVNLLKARPDNLKDGFESFAYSSNWSDWDVAFLESVGIKAASADELSGDRLERPHLIVSFVPYQNPEIVSPASPSDPPSYIDCLGVKISWKRAMTATIVKRLFTYYHKRHDFTHTPSILRNGDEDTLSQFCKKPERVNSVGGKANSESNGSGTDCSTSKAAQEPPTGSETCTENHGKRLEQDRPTDEHLRTVLEAFCWNLGVKQVPDLASLPEAVLENLVSRRQRGDIPPSDEKMPEPAEPAKLDKSKDEQLYAALEVICKSQSIKPIPNYNSLFEKQIEEVETGCRRRGLLPMTVHYVGQDVPSEGVGHVDMEILLLLNAENIAEAPEVLCCTCFIVGCVMVWSIILAYANNKGSSSLRSRPAVQGINSAGLSERKQHVDQCVGAISERPEQDIPVDLERRRLEKLATLALLEEAVKPNGVEHPPIREGSRWLPAVYRQF